METSSQVGSTYQTSVSISSITSDAIVVSYQSMPGNLPGTYGDFIAIWQNADTIPWNSQPLAMQPVSTNAQSGSVVFAGLSVTPGTYIIGYAAGPLLDGGNKQPYGNICATTFSPVGSDTAAGTSFSSSLSLVQVGSTSVVLEYSMPDGIMPHTNGAWLGLWMGNMASFTIPPMAKAPLTTDNSRGSVVFNNVMIMRGATYTVGLFTSGPQTTLACSVTFSV